MLGGGRITRTTIIRRLAVVEVSWRGGWGGHHRSSWSQEGEVVWIPGLRTALTPERRMPRPAPRASMPPGLTGVVRKVQGELMAAEELSGLIPLTTEVAVVVVDLVATVELMSGEVKLKVASPI